MVHLEKELECRTFLDQLATASERALLLDYDGTLAPFTEDRGHAVPYPAVPGLLEKVIHTPGTRVAVISGRSAKEVRSLLGIEPHPEIWGTHGLERLRPGGAYEIVSLEDKALRGLAEADSALVLEGLGKQAEFKPGAVAVHWRGLGEAAKNEVRAAAYRAWQPLARQYGLWLGEFDGGVELRVATRNKADAVRTILSELSGDAPVAYLGDDQTDEDAFRALRGRGLRVLVRPERRPTEADVWLKPPEELMEFLNECLHACGGEA